MPVETWKRDFVYTLNWCGSIFKRHTLVKCIRTFFGKVFFPLVILVNFSFNKIRKQTIFLWWSSQWVRKFYLAEWMECEGDKYANTWLITSTFLWCNSKTCLFWVFFSFVFDWLEVSTKIPFPISNQFECSKS